MRILFLHQNFPAQFLHVALALKARRDTELVAVTHAGNTRPRLIPTRAYAFDPRQVATSVPLAEHYAQRLARGAALVPVLEGLRREGFTPDLVIGHGGWGETLFVRDVWPGARLLVHAEYYYTAEGADVGFDPEFADVSLLDARLRVRSRNTAMLQALSDADRAVTPTRWQAGLFPPALASKIAVAHEGIDTHTLTPGPATLSLKRDRLTLTPGDEVVTFVARGLEPYRGFHVFMRALPEIMRRRPAARAVIVGGLEASYGPLAPLGKTWKDVYLAEVRDRIDMRRIHFVGRVPHGVLAQVLRLSAAHVYLTYPFVLSWSMLEAMSCGALIVGSATPSVEEVIEHGVNGLLVPFFDTQALAERVVEALARPERFAPLREAARRTIVDRYDLATVCLPRWLKLIEDTAGARV